MRYWFRIVPIIFMMALTVQAQGYTLSTSPQSGPPGTQVTLTTGGNSSTFSSQVCFANGQSIGGPPPLTYTVPQGAQGTIVFHCENGFTGEFFERTNDSFFAVDAPPPPPDDSPPPPPPPDESQPPPPPPDDSQPAQPAQPAQPTSPPPPTARPLPLLPLDGTCYVATAGASSVNIRADATTSSAIIGTLDPYQIYVADVQSFQLDGIWYGLRGGGYVASFVTRQTPACDELLVEGLDILDDDGEGGTVRLAIVSHDFETMFAECPELLVYLESVPIHVLNHFIGIAEVDPDMPMCDVLMDYVLAILGGGLFSVVNDIPPEILDRLMNECPGKLVGWVLVLDLAAQTNTDVYQEALRRLPEDICNATDDFIESLRGFTGADYTAWLNEFALGYLVELRCGVDLRGRSIRELGVLSLINYEDGIYNFGDICADVERAFLIGELSEADRAFHDALVETCGRNIAGDTGLVFYIFYTMRVNGINPQTVPMDSALCGDDVTGYLRQFEPDSLVDGRSADIPPQLSSCPEMARLLRAQNAGLDPYVLVAILNAPDPCGAASNYLIHGVHPAYAGAPLTCDTDYVPEVSVTVLEGDRRGNGGDDTGALVACGVATLFPIPELITACAATGTAATARRGVQAATREGGTSQGRVRTDGGAVRVVVGDEGATVHRPNMTLVLADGSVVDTRSSWDEKVAALGRNPENICSQPPPRLANPTPDERICYGVTFLLRDDSLLSGVAFGPDVGIAIVTNFSDGRPSVMETSYQMVRVRRGGSADLSFVAYVTNRAGDFSAQYGVDVSGLPNLDLVTTTGIRHGRVDESFCRNNTTPRSGDYTELPSRFSVSVSVLPSIGLLFVEDDTSADAPPADAPPADAPPADAPPADAPPADAPSAGVLSGSVPLPSGDSTSSEPIRESDITVVDTRLPEAPRMVAMAVTSENVDDLTTWFNPLFSGRLDGTEAIFQAGVEGQEDLYIMRNGVVEPVFEERDVRRTLPAFNPHGGMVGFLESPPGAPSSLVVYNFVSGERRTLFTEGNGLQLLPHRPAWMPNARDLIIMVSMQDGEGRTGIYLLDLLDEEGAPLLIVEGGYEPVVARGGVFMAYVKDINGVPNIFTQTLSNNREQAITDQREGEGCTSPTFSNNPTVMFFVCDQAGEGKLYRYDLTGLNPVNLPVASIRRAVAGPIDGFISYDDGESIYLSSFDGRVNAPLVTVGDLPVSHVHWATAP